MRTSASKNFFSKGPILWILVLLLGVLGLLTINFIMPLRPQLPLPPIPVQLTVGCFLEGVPIFRGEVQGPLKIDEKGVISFYSLELASEMVMVNVSCVSMESKPIVPIVYKADEPRKHKEQDIF